MSNLYADGDLFLPIRTKINALAALLKIAETDAIITAGAVTSIPIVALTKDILASGNDVTMIDATTGEAYLLTLSAAATAASESLTVNSYVFASDVPSGSGIYYSMTDLLNRIYAV